MDIAAHSGQASHNYALTLERCLLDHYHDWVITVCFYSALHLIDVELARHNEHPRLHTQREPLVKRLLDPQYPGIFDAFYNLSEQSQKARYYCIPVGALDAAKARAYLADIRRLLKIK